VIPADHKPVMQAMVAAILVDTIHSLDLRLPEVSEEARVANAEARRRLVAEPEETAEETPWIRMRRSPTTD
jgi:hypothetical protein